jgi:hypothetical protein
MLNSPEASELEIKISTFGQYKSVDLELYVDESCIGKLQNITSAGLYHLPLNDNVTYAPCEVKLMVNGHDKYMDIEVRDLCILLII